MSNIVVRVKGIVKRGDEYLILKRWYDDRIPDPFMWEFIDGPVAFGEDPINAQNRIIGECLGVPSTVVRPAYTWSNNIGDTQIIGIAYICQVADEDEFVLAEDFGGYEWIKREQFDDYIENMYVLQDIKDVEL